jgi:hypothetical protein
MINAAGEKCVTDLVIELVPAPAVDWSSIGYGIEAALGQRVAAADSPQRQSAAADQAKALDGDEGVLRAGRQVDAVRHAEAVQDRRDEPAVDSEDQA